MQGRQIILISVACFPTCQVAASVCFNLTIFFKRVGMWTGCKLMVDNYSLNFFLELYFSLNLITDFFGRVSKLWFVIIYFIEKSKCDPPFVGTIHDWLKYFSVQCSTYELRFTGQHIYPRPFNKRISTLKASRSTKTGIDRNNMTKYKIIRHKKIDVLIRSVELVSSTTFQPMIHLALQRCVLRN